MNKEILTLLSILTKDETGRRVRELINENNISCNAIRLAKERRYIRLTHEGRDMDIVFDDYYCVITEKGSELKDKIKKDRMSKAYKISALIISAISAIFTLVKCA